MTRLPAIIASGAHFGGPNRCYRYRLWREFETGQGTCVFVMLNPSTAGEHVNDPTVRRCLGYTARWGCQRLEVVNLYGLRATQPAALWTHRDPIGPGNHAAIQSACAESRWTRFVILAWGTHGARNGRGDAVRQSLGLVFTPAYVEARVGVLRWTKGGQPAHPLYLPATLRPRT